MRATAVMLLLLLAAMVLVAGCPQQQVVEEEGPIAPPEEVQPTPEEGEPAAAVGEFAWTETPSLDAIPEGNITGMINGEPFAAQTVRLRQDGEQTRLEISNVSVDGPTGLTMDDTGVDLKFTLTPGQPGEFVIAMEDEKDIGTRWATYNYPLPDDGGPMTENPSWACALQITEWTLEAAEENEDILGNAKGKVAITFDDEEKSWVAGTFEGVYYKW